MNCRTTDVNVSIATWEDAVLWLRGQPDRQQLVIDCYYEDPLSAAADRYWQSGEWNAIREFLPATGGRALDVGAGRGIASYALAREGFEVTALEPDPSETVGAGAIRSLAGSARLPIKVVEEFSERLPFADEAFDLVFARAVLHHTRDLEGACREFFRVLKPGGRLLAVREHVISRPSDLAYFLAHHPLHKLYGGENAFLLSRYLTAMRSAGLRIVKVLNPWSSPINYAPKTDVRLKADLVDLARARSSLLARVLAFALQSPTGWKIICSLLGKIDRRPGRLYSFVAQKPE